MMENKVSIPDEEQRQTALDVTRSFIVQAPAGSGKTELLTQRFLALLGQAISVPEEIIAITFTRKAAAEMRERIIDALLFAKNNPAPLMPHTLKTWRLAKAVLEKDSINNWCILQNPNRLRIFTIDSLCARIAKAAPLLSHFGSVPNVVEDATEYYVLAAQALLSSLEDNQSYADALEQLLLHLDNNYLVIERLFIGMLQRRDQWLPYIAGEKDPQYLRSKLEQALTNIIIEAMTKCRSIINDNKMSAELIALANYASSQLREEKENCTIMQCKNLTALPEISPSQLLKWQGLAELLLTQKFEWRRSVTKNIGFPPHSQAKDKSEQERFKSMKERMLVFLSSVEDNELFRIALQEILLLPPANYTEKQWCIIEAMMQLLPRLVAHLRVIFQENKVVDFTEIAQGAITALGDFHQPSDLSLNLDYKIKHILVDEFQDTSFTQFHLLELLIQGWCPNDGRTLFLVGDPMQSIYRFREADVAIFLRVKQTGIGSLRPEALTLHVNFRSEKGIIEWINEKFSQVFPVTENIQCGAVSYNFSQAVHDNTLDQHVFFHNVNAENEQDETNLIINTIKTAIQKDPHTSIAILVRSRTHLQHIIPQLKSAKIPFHAVEIEKLINCSVVQDLFALTKALCHLGDRVAWWAILRAPWCGLTLADLVALANMDRHKTLWELIQDAHQNPQLSSDGLARITRVTPILAEALANRRRDRLRNHVEYVWYHLGGPACIDFEHELENAERFFQLLDDVDYAGDILSFELLESKLDNLYTHSTSNNNTNVHIMTIHKAKGLEFDTIILPGLNKKPASDDNRLLLWCERKNILQENDLILAPIKSLDDEFDPIYRYVRIQDNIRARHEMVRLLYVAATRAKKCIHFIATMDINPETRQYKLPESGSFLELLWPQVNSEFPLQYERNLPEEITDLNMIRYIKRLSLNWQSPCHTNNEQPSLQNSYLKYQWQAEYHHHVGTVIHEVLQKISLSSLEQWNSKKLAEQANLWRRKLLQLGVNEIFISECLATIEAAITFTLQDERGRWILDCSYDSAYSEFPVTSVVDQKICHYIIDRCFIDKTGKFWIIDYKTTAIDEKDTRGFLRAAKQQHQVQLHAYAAALNKIYPTHPIHIGLYFPLFKGWIEWQW